MTDISTRAIEIFDMVTQKDFDIIKTNIDIATKRRDYETRFQLGQIYNKLSVFKYEVRKIDLNGGNAANELNKLESKILEQQNALKQLLKQANNVKL